MLTFSSENIFEQIGERSVGQVENRGIVPLNSSQININRGTDTESTPVSFSEAVPLPKKPAGQRIRSNIKKKYPGIEEFTSRFLSLT